MELARTEVSEPGRPRPRERRWVPISFSRPPHEPAVELR